jgi:hypothetical protein
MPRHPSSRGGDAAGQASVELVAVLPFACLVCAVVWQVVLAGHAAWAAGSAARAAARASAVGLDPKAAARSALPGGLERRLSVREGSGGAVSVGVRIPSVAGDLLPLGSVTATARFAPQDG